MTSSVFHCACYLTILFLCVDEGHGRWKHMNREKINHRIAALKLMADKLEHEVDDYYYDNSNLEDKSVHYDKQETVTRIYEYRNPENRYISFFQNLPKISNKNASNDSKHIKHQITSEAVENNEIKSGVMTETSEALKRYSRPRSKTEETRWPKFEEMLLAMGKKYDWKNDRWIKIKKEPKSEDVTASNGEIDRLDFLSKHRFIYRTVKLNRVKTKRNIVIAVTAIR